MSFLTLVMLVDSGPGMPFLPTRGGGMPPFELLQYFQGDLKQKRDCQSQFIFCFNVKMN